MGRAFEYRKAAKMKRWGAMSRIFPKLGKIIQMAAKEGGGDPDMNPKLRTAILNAKAANMPKDNIDAAIKRATAKDSAQMLEVTFECKAPHGVLIFLECATDNNTRTVANVKSYITKNGGELLTNGSLDFMFSRKAIVEFEKKDDMDLEELEMELIDAGLEEMEEAKEPQENDEDLDIVILTADYTDFGNLVHKCEELGIEIKKANLKRVANTPIELSEAEHSDLERLFDKLDEDEDVTEVYTNIE